MFGDVGYQMGAWDNLRPVGFEGGILLEKLADMSVQHTPGSLDAWLVRPIGPADMELNCHMVLTSRPFMDIAMCAADDAVIVVDW